MGKRKSKKAAEKQHKKRRLGLGKILVLLVISAIGGLALSEPLRNKALDALFGAEEEFQYTPPITEATPENGASAT